MQKKSGEQGYSVRDKYLIDSNIVIYFFNGLTDDEKIFEILKSSFNISIVSKIEFLSWKKLTNDKQLLNKAEEFLSYAHIIDLDDKIANQTIIYRRAYGLKTPDAIIAATARIHNLKLLTNNTKDFGKLDLSIDNIRLRD